MRILVAGIGNILRGDDGFGIAVIEELRQHNLSEQVEIFEAGIAGISLVQELMNGYEALIIADTIDRGGKPGTVYVIEPERVKNKIGSANELHKSLVDAHYADPSKVLLLAAALSVLPEQVFIVACQPESIEHAKEELSDRVRAAISVAVTKIDELIEKLLAEGAGKDHSGN